MYGRGRRNATNSSHPPVILQAYLYIRMYYNKIRKTVNYWWDAYLLFKCSITVLPIYLILVIIGVYCIVYNIDVNVSLKTVYQAIFLPLSAAVIFIFVLLLATFNGDNRCPDEVNSNVEQYEVDLDSIQLPRRYSNLDRSGGRHGNRASISSSIWSAIFGNYNDEEDEEFDEDATDSGGVILTMTAEEAQEHGLIPTFGHLPPSVLLNQAQTQLVNSLEQTTAGIEYFLDQCNSFDQFINADDDNSEQLAEHQNFLPPPCYYADSSTNVPTDYQHQTFNQLTDYQSSSILPPSRSTAPFQCHLAPAIPPTYSSCNINSILHQSSVVDISRESNSPARDFPPSYEEATKEA